MKRLLSRSAIAAVMLCLPHLAHAQFDLRRILQQAGGELMHRGSCDKLKRWVESPAAESAGAGAAANQARGRLAGGDAAMNLISDEVFVPVFGKPYDRLTQAELAGYQRETLPACLKLGLFTPAQAQQVQSLLNAGSHPMFSQRLAQRRAQAEALANEQAAAANELRQIRAELDQLEASDAGLARLQQLTQRAAQLARVLPSPGTAEFDGAARLARQRLVGPAQQERIARALAEPHDAGSLARLMRVEASLDRSALPPGDAQAAQLQERIQALTAATVATLRSELGALPAGIEGLAAGVDWSHRNAENWRSSGPVPADIQRVLGDFRQLRAKQLASPLTAAQFKAAANAARTPAQAQALLSRYLLPDEGNSVGGQALQQAVTERQAVMERNVALGRSPDAPARDQQRAAAPADPPTAKHTAATSSRSEVLQRGEPSEEVMFDLVNLRFTTAAANYRDLQAKCDGMTPSDRNMGAMMDSMLCLGVKLQGAVTGNAQAEAVKITKFKKLGCERASGKPGYICDYKITTSHPINQQMGNILGGLMGAGGVGQARFLDAGDEWLIFYRGSQSD